MSKGRASGTVGISPTEPSALEVVSARGSVSFRQQLAIIGGNNLSSCYRRNLKMII